MAFSDLRHKFNPIIVREMRARMRGRRSFLVLTGHVILLCLLVGIIYTAIYYDEIYRAGYNANIITLAQHGSTIGKATFIGTVLLLLAIFTFVAPAFGAGAIAGERERQTYDTLLLTPLRGKHIVLGKLGSIISLLVLFILASYPLQSVAYFFGGVAIPEIMISTIGLLITAWSLSALGLYISTWVRTTTIAVTITYAILIPLVYGLPFLIIFITDGPADNYLNRLSGITRFLYEYIMYLVMSLNPFFAAILTGEAAAQGHGYFFYHDSSAGPINFDRTRWLLSSWLIYAGLNLLLGYFMTRWAIRRIDKIA